MSHDTTKATSTSHDIVWLLLLVALTSAAAVVRPGWPTFAAALAALLLSARGILRHQLDVVLEVDASKDIASRVVITPAAPFPGRETWPPQPQLDPALIVHDVGEELADVEVAVANGPHQPS